MTKLILKKINSKTPLPFLAAAITRKGEIFQMFFITKRTEGLKGTYSGTLVYGKYPRQWDDHKPGYFSPLINGSALRRITNIEAISQLMPSDASTALKGK